MASSNPALNDKVFQRESANATGGFSPGWGAPGQPGQQPPPTPVGDPSDTMRMSGTMSATAILLGIFLVAGWFGWQAVTVTTGLNPAGETVVLETNFPAWLFGAFIVGFLLAIGTIFRPKVARITGPLYSVAQGLAVGAISHTYEVRFDGIVLQAIGLTVGVFAIMLVLFATGTVRVTDKLRTGIFAATGAIMLVYLVSIVFRLFGSDVPMIHDSGAVGIGFSLLVVGIAAMNLLLDFDFVQRGVAARAPRHMEWFAAFGLMITLVWLYLELLRLISKLRSN